MHAGQTELRYSQIDDNLISAKPADVLSIVRTLSIRTRLKSWVNPNNSVGGGLDL